MIQVDERTWNLVLKMLKTLGEQVAEVRTDVRRAYDPTDHGTTPIVARKADSLNDQSPALQALADRIVNSSIGSKLWIPSSPYVVNEGISIPENRAIVIDGDGPGWRSAAGKGSVLQRLEEPSADAITATEGAIIAYLGSDSGDSDRAIGAVRHLQLDGGASIGVSEGIGLKVQRGQEFDVEDLRLYNFPGVALRANQIFNGTWRKLRITHSGNDDDAAFHIGGAGTPGNTDGTITLDVIGLQMEQNAGTDLKITGNSVGVGHPSTEINIVGGKWEGPGDGSNANPYHHFEFAELVNLSSLGIFSFRSVPAILCEHLVTGPGEDRGVRYSNCWFELGAGITPPDYFVEVLGGSVHFSNCTFKMDVGTAFAHVGPSAREGAISFGDCKFIDLSGGRSTAPLLHDER